MTSTADITQKAPHKSHNKSDTNQKYQRRK